MPELNNTDDNYDYGYFDSTADVDAFIKALFEHEVAEHSHMRCKDVQVTRQGKPRMLSGCIFAKSGSIRMDCGKLNRIERVLLLGHAALGISGARTLASRIQNSLEEKLTASLPKGVVSIKDSGFFIKLPDGETELQTTTDDSATVLFAVIKSSGNGARFRLHSN
ncbi:hypothetical protein [Atopomonas sediminilitoris]|uniref:hypothetical protein n=1 Tax=Atopomonas sediminilitoris TaxID=2919919 RepID=UPI001F4D7AC5|nr:hypothetical protein [Atopomonas sediminilitoris]MCJ8170780.1 hypothetical protein [Atopomonas sediminilitoris]